MRVSIIIPTYNRCESLWRTLESILQQKVGDKLIYEVIVVDNNSSDKTKEVVYSYIPMFDTRLKYIFEPNQGRSYALNSGIKVATGELIAFTDDDCILKNNWLKIISERFCDKEIDYLCGRVIPIFNTSKPRWLDIEKFKHLIVNFDLSDKYIKGTFNKALGGVGANSIFRKKSYDRYGDFKFCGRLQDADLVNRWKVQGAVIAYDPELIIYHYVTKDKLNKPYFRKWYFIWGINQVYIKKEFYRKSRLFLGVPLWFIRELAIAIITYIKNLFSRGDKKFASEVQVWSCLGKIVACFNFVKLDPRF